MKQFLLIAITLTFTLSSAYADNHLKPQVDKSKTIVKEFMGQLKGELQTAMKSGGPVKAINVCKESAPFIAKSLSDKYGWKVARTSFKNRNPSNAPDNWEAMVLEKFNARHAAGESLKNMTYFEIVEEKGQKNFRFMKAIGMPPLKKMPCLKCHGENIDIKISSKLDELYPNDKARGYKPGEIRGAFTITQPLN